MYKSNQESQTYQSESPIQTERDSQYIFNKLSSHISDLKNMLVDFNQKLFHWKYKIENGKGWISSYQRQSFFNLIQKARSMKQSAILQIKGPKINHYKTLNESSKKTISKCQQIGAKCLQQPIEQLFSKYKNATTFCIQLFKRDHPFVFEYKTINNHSCFQVSNIFSALNLILSDQYYSNMKQQYDQYLVSVLETDLSWVNNNLTLPEKYKFVDQHIVRKTYLQLAQNLAYCRMYDIIQTYDIELIVQIIWRQIFYNNDIADKQDLKNMQYFPQGFLMADHLRCVMRGFVDEKIVFNEDYYQISLTVFKKKSVITCKNNQYFVRYDDQQMQTN